MKSFPSKPLKLVTNILLILFLLAPASLPVVASQPASNQTEAPTQAEKTAVVRVYFENQSELEQLARTLDILEVNHVEGYLVALLSPQRLAELEKAGYRVEID